MLSHHPRHYRQLSYVLKAICSKSHFFFHVKKPTIQKFTTLRDSSPFPDSPTGPVGWGGGRSSGWSLGRKDEVSAVRLRPSQCHPPSLRHIASPEGWIPLPYMARIQLYKPDLTPGSPDSPALDGAFAVSRDLGTGGSGTTLHSVH